MLMENYNYQYELQFTNYHNVLNQDDLKCFAEKFYH